MRRVETVLVFGPDGLVYRVHAEAEYGPDGEVAALALRTADGWEVVEVGPAAYEVLETGASFRSAELGRVVSGLLRGYPAAA